MVKGVPKGYKEFWKYGSGLWKEIKVKSNPSTWKFKYQVSKGRKSKSYGSFPKGFKGQWKINATQYIEKVGKGKYKTTMVGTKVGSKFRTNKRRK